MSKEWTYKRDSCGKYSPQGECEGGYYIDQVMTNGHGIANEATAKLICDAVNEWNQRRAINPADPDSNRPEVLQTLG